TAMRRNDMLAAQGRAVATQVARYFKLKLKSGKKTGSTTTKKKTSAPTKKKSNKITGSTYKVKRGDTLLSISKRSGKSVNNLKSWNNLTGNTIKTGQTLRLTKPTTKKKPTKKSSGLKYIGGWKRNKYGTQYRRATGKFTVTAKNGIYIRNGSPFTSAPSPGQLRRGKTVKVTGICRQDGYVWVEYRTTKGGWRYVPFNTWNSKTGAVGKTAWGKFSRSEERRVGKEGRAGWLRCESRRETQCRGT